MRIWYGIHPSELDDIYALRLYADTCIAIRRDLTDRLRMLYLYELLIENVLPSKGISVKSKVDFEKRPLRDAYPYLFENDVAVHWPMTSIPLRRRIADVKDWQAICAAERLIPEKLHSITTYGVWPGGSNNIHYPTDETKITDAEILQYVRNVKPVVQSNREVNSVALV